MKKINEEYLSNNIGSFLYYLTKVVSVVCSLVCCVLLSEPAQIKVAMFWLFAMNFYLIFLNRNCRYTLVVSLFLLWFNYSIYFANYFLKLDTIFTSWAYQDVSVLGFKIVLIFTTVLCFFSNGINHVPIEDDKAYPKLLTDDTPSFSIFGYCYLIALVALLIFGFGRPDEAGERGAPSTFYEYSTIIFIVGFYFFKWDKCYKRIAIALLMLFALQNLIFGGRITALQLILLLLFFIYDGKKMSITRLMPLGILAFAIFTLVGSMRAETTLSISNLIKSVTDSFSLGLTLDTSYSAYYTSLTFLKVEDCVEYSQRLSMLFAFLLSMIFGGSAVPNSNLAAFTKNYYMHYMGGVLPFFGHFYLGFIGVIAFGLLISWYMNLIKKAHNKSGFFKCATIYITITTPRWYLYSPSQLIRGVFLLSIVYYVTLVITKFCKEVKFI